MQSNIYCLISLCIYGFNNKRADNSLLFVHYTGRDLSAVSTKTEQIAPEAQ